MTAKAIANIIPIAIYGQIYSLFATFYISLSFDAIMYPYIFYFCPEPVYVE